MRIPVLTPGIDSILIGTGGRSPSPMCGSKDRSLVGVPMGVEMGHECVGVVGVVQGDPVEIC